MGQPIARAAPLVGGVAAGVLLTHQLERALPSEAEERAALADGHDLDSYEDMLATAGSLAFIGSAGVTAGLARRSATAQSLPLMLLGAAGMFTSLAATTLVKSETEGRGHLVSLGLLTALGGVGYLAGASARVPMGLALNGALVGLGVFAGTAGVETTRWVGEEFRRVGDSLAWKREHGTP